MRRWIKLARKLTKVRPKVALEFLESFVNGMLPKSEEVPDINYPNRSIIIELGPKDITIYLAKYRAILDVDQMLSMSSITELQWWIHSQLAKSHPLSQEDAATISALMIQKLQEEEYIKDVTPPV